MLACGHPPGRAGQLNQVHDCTPSYALADVNASAAAWYHCNKTWHADFVSRRSRAEADCNNATHQSSGAYCLPSLDTTNWPPRVSIGRVRSVALPHNQSYYLPFWDSRHHGVNHVEADGRVVATLVKLAAEVTPDESFINDFGAGVGQYGHSLLSLVPTARYRGYDGAGNIGRWTDDFVRWIDLTDPWLSLPRAHWVMSLEVGEHIPSELEGRYLRNLHAHACRGIILSWASPAQGGQDHINNHRFDYVERQMEELGYVLNMSLTSQLRNGTPVDRMHTYTWIQNNVAAFERRDRIAPCTPRPTECHRGLPHEP